MMILGFDDYELQSRALAEVLDTSCQIVELHRFPDGEDRLTLPSELPAHVVFCRSLDHPNSKLLELLLAAKTARELGAQELTLVAPYLCYMRQDKAFHPGEAVSQRIIGNFLSDLFDNLITVDPHLHRIQYLQQAVPAKNAVTLSATSLMAAFVADLKTDPVLLGPDSEAEQWVASVAEPNNLAYGVCDKLRSGDREIEITLPGIDMQGRNVVLIDDVASSGQTLTVAIRKCISRGARNVDVLVTHALFAGDAIQRMQRAGVGNIWSTDSISHESNVMPLKGILGSAVKSLAQ